MTPRTVVSVGKSEATPQVTLWIGRRRGAAMKASVQFSVSMGTHNNLKFTENRERRSVRVGASLFIKQPGSAHNED